MPQAVQVPIGFTANTASLNRTTQQVKSALGRITGNASEFQKSLDASTARVFAFGATTAVITGVSTAFKALLGTTIEVEARMVEIQSIFGGTASEFGEFRETIFQVAKDTGQSFSTVADAATEFARQGLSAVETTKRLNDALVLSKLSGLDSVKSVKTLTAAINGYSSANLTSTQITDKIIAVDRKFAVSAEDLSNAISRAASSAEDAGVSFDEFLGLVTAIETKTARGGAVIGNGLKTIFTRIGRQSVIDDLQALGVAIDASQSGAQKLQAIGAAFEAAKGDSTKQGAIKELAAGGFQINLISAALKDLIKDQNIYNDVIQTSSDSAGASSKAIASQQKTLQFQLNALISGFTNLGEKIGGITLLPILKTLTSIAEKAGSFLNDAFDPETGSKLIQGIFKTIGSFITGPGLVLITGAFAKIVLLVSRYAKEGFKSILEIGTQTEKLKALEQEISAELQEGSSLRKTMLSSSATLLDKQLALNNALKAANDLHTREQQLLGETAKILAGLGVRGRDAAGLYVGANGKPIKTKAGGYSPSFTETIAETSAAREHGYKAGKVFNTKLYDGTGGSFQATVNSAEKIKTIRGPNGKLGTYVIPPNGFAKGFVPNYSGLGKNILQIGKMNASALRQFMGTKTFAQTPNSDPVKQAAIAREQQLGTQIQAREAQRVQLKGSNFGMLVPNIGYNQTLSQFQGSVGTDPYVIDNLAIRGPNPSRATSLGNDDERLKSNIYKTILDEGAKFGNSLDGSRLNRNSMASQLVQNEGYKGAVNSAVGAAFEAAVLAAYPTERYSTAKTNLLNKFAGNFDLRGAGSKIQTLFSLPKSATTLDFKASADGDSVSSFVGKIMKEQSTSSSEKSKATKLATRRGLATGFVPNFAAFTKRKYDLSTGSGIKKSRSYTTDAGSSLSFVPDLKKKEFDIGYVKSKRKGDAYALFQYLSKIAKKTKSTIYSSELLPQKENQTNPFAGVEGDNWSKLVSVFPQLRYRDVPKSQTSLALQHAGTGPNQDAIAKTFDELGSLKQYVNSFSQMDFETGFKETFLHNVKTKMLGGGFVPNFVSPNALKSLQLRASYKGGDPRLLAEAANARRILSKQNKGGVNLRTVFDKLDGESGISQIIDSAFSAAGPTASNEDVFRVFEAQTRQNPQKLRELVKRRGFVPNFSAVQDAISREKKAGIPASAIYVDQNPQLRGPRNPAGLMVANTIDEPLGGAQGIRRSKSEGRNPKSYGAGGGFVPNFAAKIGSISEPSLSSNQLQSANKALQELAKKIQQNAITVDEARIEFLKLSKKLSQSTKKQDLINSKGQGLIGAYENETKSRNALAAVLKQGRAGTAGGSGTAGYFTKKRSVENFSAKLDGASNKLFSAQIGLFALSSAAQTLAGDNEELSEKISDVVSGVGVFFSALQLLPLAMSPLGIAAIGLTAAFGPLAYTIFETNARISKANKEIQETDIKLKSFKEKRTSDRDLASNVFGPKDLGENFASKFEKRLENDFAKEKSLRDESQGLEGRLEEFKGLKDGATQIKKKNLFGAAEATTVGEIRSTIQKRLAEIDKEYIEQTRIINSNTKEYEEINTQIRSYQKALKDAQSVVLRLSKGGSNRLQSLASEVFENLGVAQKNLSSKREERDQKEIDITKKSLSDEEKNALAKRIEELGLEIEDARKVEKFATEALKSLSSGLENSDKKLTQSFDSLSSSLNGYSENVKAASQTAKNKLEVSSILKDFDVSNSTFGEKLKGKFEDFDAKESAKRGESDLKSSFIKGFLSTIKDKDSIKVDEAGIQKYKDSLTSAAIDRNGNLSPVDSAEIESKTIEFRAKEIQKAMDSASNFAKNLQKNGNMDAFIGGFFDTFLNKGEDAAVRLFDSAFSKLNLSESASEDLRKALVDGSVSARDAIKSAGNYFANKQIQASIQIAQTNKEIIAAQKSALQDLPSKLKGILDGPKIDPLKLFGDIKKATELLRSKDSKKRVEGTRLLASTQEQADLYKSRRGEAAFAETLERTGINNKDYVTASRTAEISLGTDFSGIKNFVETQLDGGGKRNATDILNKAQSDPSQLANLIQLLQEISNNTENVSKKEKISNVISSLRDVAPITLRDVSSKFGQLVKNSQEPDQKPDLAGLKTFDEARNKLAKNPKSEELKEELKKAIKNLLGNMFTEKQKEDFSGKYSGAFSKALSGPSFTGEAEEVEKLKEQKSKLVEALQSSIDSANNLAKSLTIGDDFNKKIKSLAAAVESASVGVGSFKTMAKALEDLSTVTTLRLDEAFILIAGAKK